MNALTWDFTVVACDEVAFRELADVAALGVLHVRARLDVAVPDGCRSVEALADLAHADSVAAWNTALFLATAARGPQVFLGRRTSLSSLAALADPPLAEALRALDVPELLLVPYPGDPDGHRVRWGSDEVRRIAGHAERLGVSPLASEDVNALLAHWRWRHRPEGDRPLSAFADADVEAWLSPGPRAAPSGWIERWFRRRTTEPDTPLLRLFLGWVRHLAQGPYGLVASCGSLGPSLLASRERGRSGVLPEPGDLTVRRHGPWPEVFPRPLAFPDGDPRLVIRIRDVRTGEISVRDLGSFRVAWNGGLSFGSDPGCRVVLEDLAPRHVVARAGSNHQMVEPLEGEVHFGGRVVPPGTTCRVDQRPFRLGPYDVQLGTSTGGVFRGPPLDDLDWDPSTDPAPMPAEPGRP